MTDKVYITSVESTTALVRKVLDSLVQILEVYMYEKKKKKFNTSYIAQGSKMEK